MDGKWCEVIARLERLEKNAGLLPEKPKNLAYKIEKAWVNQDAYADATTLRSQVAA